MKALSESYDVESAAEAAPDPFAPGVAADDGRLILRGGTLTVASQAISSGTTFLRMVLLARVCSEEVVGLYAMAFTGVMLLFTAHERLIESGYLVAVHRRRDAGQQALLGSTIVFSLWFSTIGAIAIAIAGVGAALLGWAGWLDASSAMASALLAAAIMTPPIVFRELARSAAFAHFELMTATVIDVVTLVVQAALLLLFWQTGWLGVETTYLAIGASSLVACLWWAYEWRDRWTVVRSQLADDWREVWAFTRWLLAARMLGQGSRFIMPWIVAAYLGAAGAGVLAICLTLVGLSYLFVRGVNNYFRPRTVYAFYHGGGPAVRAEVRRTSWIYFALLGGLCLVYAVAGDLLVESVVGHPVPNAWLTIVILGAGTLATSLALAPTNGLSAIDRPQANIWIEGLTFVATAVLAPILVPLYGLAGAAMAMLVGNTVGAVVAYVAFERELARLDDGGPASPTRSEATSPEDSEGVGYFEQATSDATAMAAVGELNAATLPLVSVVITTFNRAATLSHSLASVAAQHTEGEIALEIVVVDNGSIDDTRRVVDAIAEGAPCEVRYCYEGKQGLPFARNRGLREARGEWVAFFDDDQLAPADWLLTLFRFAQSQDLRCVGGARTLSFAVEPSAPLAPYCRQLLGESLGDAQRPEAPLQYGRTLLPTTGNVLVQRSVFDQLGGFNETWLEGGEDTEFFNRLVTSGVEAWFTPTAVVEHLIPQSRLAPGNLERIARRHGVTIGRRDLDERGRWQLPFWMGVRLVHGAAVFAPRLMTATLAGDSATELAWRCRLRRLEGYARFSLQAIVPRLFRQERFLANMVHRDARAEEAARPRVSPSRPLTRIEPAEKAS